MRARARIFLNQTHLSMKTTKTPKQNKNETRTWGQVTLLKPTSESYTTHKKRRISDTGVTTENTAPKTIADHISELEQNAAKRKANRTRARIATSTQTRSYLALNWQRGQVNAGFTSRDLRFPTPQPTTAPVFRPNQRGKGISLLPIWLRNSGVRCHACSGAAAGGEAGGQRRAAAKLPRSIRSQGIFCTNGSPRPLTAASKKGPAQAHTTPAPQQLTRFCEFPT
jgi:hypothetical protein